MNNVLVTSHIGRDLLHSANIFKTADVAVWEYIVNSLQYVPHGISPSITVDVNNRNKEIVIKDNGRGMDLEGLNNFFTMHGENQDRNQGRSGRGKFGTGKSAAFGIGNTLTITSVCNGKKNIVRLTKEDIKNSNGKAIPVTQILVDEKSNENTGTVIHISDIFLPKIDSAKIVKKIEKHLQSFRHLDPKILVGDHVCEYKEPSFEKEFKFHPDENLKKYLGSIELIIKISLVPLPQDERGILISCGQGNLVALEDAGVCSKEMGEYLFGDVDVPNLESDSYEMDAFDASRDMKLRPEHPVVIALSMFLGTSLDEVRKVLVKEKKESSKDEANKRLKDQADKIADLLNRDFKEVNDKILQIRSSTPQSGPTLSDLTKDIGGDFQDEEGWVTGIDERGDLGNSNSKVGDGDGSGMPEPDLPKRGIPNVKGDASVDRSQNTTNKKQRRPRGGFEVVYIRMGEDEDRVTYTPDKGVFNVNLDHPLLKAAVKHLGVDDIGFLRLSHEIVFTEYALALANLAAIEDPDMPADDLIYDARETINRISKKSASLYDSFV